MTDFPEQVPDVIPQTVAARAHFVKHRYVDYKEALTDGEPGSMPLDRAKPIAKAWAEEDLESLLGRRGDRAFRIQLDFEERRSVSFEHRFDRRAAGEAVP